MKMPTSPREVGTPDRTAGQKYSAQEVSAPGMIRTCDTGFRRAVLYPLSYGGGPDRSLPPFVQRPITQRPITQRPITVALIATR